LKIIDIRDNSLFNKYHLPEAINISFYNLLSNPDNYLNKQDNYLIVCEYGIKSKKTSEILNNMGYHTSSMDGGMCKIV